MEIVYTEKAKEDIAYWKKSGNKQIQKRISELIIINWYNTLQGHW